MVTEADWWGWKPEQFDPYLNVILESFRPERLMIGSDWPVCTIAAPYEVVFSAALKAIGNLDKQEKFSLMGGNAMKFYQIN